MEEQRMDAESLARQHARFRKEVRNMEQECKSLRQRLLFSADEVKRAQDFIERAESLSAEISMVSDASLEGDTPVIEAEAQSLLEEVTSIEGEYQELRERLPWSAGTASNAKEISRKMAQLQRRFSVLQQKEASRANLSEVLDYSDEDVFPSGSPLFSESSNPGSRARSARSTGRSTSGSEMRPRSGILRPVSAKSVGFSSGSDRPKSGKQTNFLSDDGASFRTALESDSADSVISERTDPTPAWICGAAAESDEEQSSDAEGEKEEEFRDERELAVLAERMDVLEKECRALRKRMLYTTNVAEDAVELRRRLKELSQLLSEKARKERRRKKAKAARDFRRQVQREARSIQQQIQQLQSLTTWNASGELDVTTEEVDRALELSMNLASLNQTLTEVDDVETDRSGSGSSASFLSRKSGSIRGSPPSSTLRSGKSRLGSAQGRPVSCRRRVWRSEAREETMARFQQILSSCVAVQSKHPEKTADASDGRALMGGIFVFMLDPEAPHPFDDAPAIEDGVEDGDATAEAEEKESEAVEGPAEPELKPLKPWVDLQIGEQSFQGRRIHPGRFEAIEGVVVKARPSRAQVDVTNVDAMQGQIAIVEGDPVSLQKGKVSNLVKVERCARAGAIAVLIRHDAESVDFESIDFENNPWPTNLLMIPVLAVKSPAGEALVEGVAISITDGASRPTTAEVEVDEVDLATRQRENDRKYGLAQGTLHQGLLERMGVGAMQRSRADASGKVDGVRMPKLLGLRVFQKAYEEQGAVIEAARRIAANEKLVDGLVARIQALHTYQGEWEYQAAQKARKDKELAAQNQFRSLNRYGSSMRLLTPSMRGETQMTIAPQEPPRQDPSVSEQVLSLECTLWEVKRQMDPCSQCDCGGHLTDLSEHASLGPAERDEGQGSERPPSNQSTAPAPPALSAPSKAEVQMWNLGLLAREQIRPVLRTALLVAVDTAYRGEGGETEIAMLVAAKVKDLYPTLQRPGTGDTGIAVHADAVPIPEDEEKKKWTLFMAVRMGELVENLRTEAKLEEKGEELGVLHAKKEKLEQQIEEVREKIEKITETGHVAAQIQKMWRGYVYRVLLRRKGFPCAVSPIERQMREWIYLLAITLGTGILVRRDEDGGVYIGQVNADLEPNGAGILTFAPKEDNDTGPQVYVGAFNAGKMEGLGVMWWTSGNVYEGSWVNDMPHGKGTEAYANGSVYQGGFSNDRRSGYGAYSFNNGTSYGGQWSGGIPHGMGVQVPRGGSSLDDGELALFNRGTPQKLPKEKRHKVETLVEVIVGVHMAIQEAKEHADGARALASSVSKMFANVMRASNAVPYVTKLHRVPPALRPSILDEEFGALPLLRPSFPYPASRGKTPRSRGMTPKIGSRPGTSAMSEIEQKVSELHSAALACDEKTVLALVKAGADLNATDVDGLTPLHYAAGDGHVVIVAFLLDAGADVMAADREGDLALHVAVQEGQLAVVEELLSRHPELVDARGAWENTALHLAAGSGEDLSRIVKCLLKRGADPQLQNDDGDSALELARRVVTTIDDHAHYRIIARHLGMDVEGSEIEAEMDGDAEVSAAECGNDIDGQRMSEDAGVMVMGGADDVATYVD